LELLLKKKGWKGIKGVMFNERRRNRLFLWNKMKTLQKARKAIKMSSQGIKTLIITNGKIILCFGELHSKLFFWIFFFEFAKFYFWTKFYTPMLKSRVIFWEVQVKPTLWIKTEVHFKDPDPFIFRFPLFIHSLAAFSVFCWNQYFFSVERVSRSLPENFFWMLPSQWPLARDEILTNSIFWG